MTLSYFSSWEHFRAKFFGVSRILRIAIGQSNLLRGNFIGKIHSILQEFNFAYPLVKMEMFFFKSGPLEIGMFWPVPHDLILF